MNRREARQHYPVQLDLGRLGALLRARRTELQLSQVAVGQRIGMSDREIANLELGRQSPSLEVFLNACHAYTLTPTAILEEITRHA